MWRTRRSVSGRSPPSPAYPRHGLQRAEPPGSGGRADPGAGPGGDQGTGVHPERVRPPAAGRPQPDHRPGRAGRGQPVLHRRGPRRGGRGQRGRPRGDPLQHRRPEGQGVPLPGGAGGAPGAGDPDHPGGRRGRPAGPGAAARHTGGAGRQPVTDPGPMLGVGRRRARRRPGGVPPSRHRPHPDRLRRRPDEYPAGGRPPGRGHAGAGAVGRAPRNCSSWRRPR